MSAPLALSSNRAGSSPSTVPSVGHTQVPKNVVTTERLVAIALASRSSISCENLLAGHRVQFQLPNGSDNRTNKTLRNYWTSTIETAPPDLLREMGRFMTAEELGLLLSLNRPSLAAKQRMEDLIKKQFSTSVDRLNSMSMLALGCENRIVALLPNLYALIESMTIENFDKGVIEV